MNQLVNPNLSVFGRVGFCLEYQAKLWGTTHNEPYAWNAWLNTKLKHTDQPPTNLSYPLWFSFYASGINMGHVVSYVPGQGYYSSPWQLGTTHAVLSSIAEIEKIYGATYVGWSEDILEKQVIGGNMIPEGQINDNDDIAELWRVAFFRDPTPQEIQDNQGLIGKYWNDACKYIRSTDAFHQVQAQYEAGATAEYVAYSGPQLYTKK